MLATLAWSRLRRNPGVVLMLVLSIRGCMRLVIVATVGRLVVINALSGAMSVPMFTACVVHSQAEKRKAGMDHEDHPAQRFRAFC